MQRGKAAEAASRAEAVETHDAEAAAITAPPGMEPITGPKRQPAEAAPSAPAQADSKSTKAEE